MCKISFVSSGDRICSEHHLWTQTPSFQSTENSYIHRLQALRQVEFGKSAIMIYIYFCEKLSSHSCADEYASHENCNMHTSLEPASSILRAVQEKHTPWTTMKLNAASSSKTLTPTYQTTLQCIPENWNCVFIS
jgi:hypothetical protein